MSAHAIDEAIAAAVARAVAPLVDEVRALRDELRQRDATEYINQSALARLLGLTPAALSMRIKRGGELAQIARTIDGRRVWARRDLEAMLSRRPAAAQAAGLKVVPR
jgi:predicted transcriptional regulator